MMWNRPHDIKKGRKNKKGWKANGGIFQSPINVIIMVLLLLQTHKKHDLMKLILLVSWHCNEADINYHSALTPLPTTCSALILMYFALSIFCFVVRNTSPMGWTIPDWISVWFDNLQRILHSRTSPTTGSFWWLCRRAPWNKVRLHFPSVVPTNLIQNMAQKELLILNPNPKWS